MRDTYTRGIFPRLGERMLPDGGLITAKDVNLEQGFIQAWNCPVSLCETDSPPLTIIDGELCCTSSKIIDVVEYTNSGCQYIIKNESGRLWIADRADACDNIWCPLTPSCPSNKPQVDIIADDERCDVQPTAYRYTYVNMYGFEGSPSKSTNMVLDGNGRASLSNLQLPPPDECIVSMRIYRLDDTYRTEGQLDASAEWLMVAEIEPATEHFDKSGYYNTSIPLNTWGAFKAPRMSGLEAMSNGALVGFNGRMLHFSDPTDLAPRPHSWSGDYDIELPDEIRGIVVNGDLLYVATDKFPYVVAPAFAGGQLVYQYTASHVLAPLKSQRSLHATPAGASYVSDMGLVQFNGRSASILSDAYFTTEQWRAANITSAISVGGRTFLMGDTSYVIFNNAGAHGHASELSPLTELTLLGNPADMAIDSNGDIVFTTDAGLSRFSFRSNGTTELCPYEIKSRIITYPGCVNLAAAKVESTEPVEFALDRIKCGQSRNVITRMTPCGPFRLPSKYLSNDYCYTLKGTADIYSISLGRTMAELFT